MRHRAVTAAVTDLAAVTAAVTDLAAVTAAAAAAPAWQRLGVRQ